MTLPLILAASGMGTLLCSLLALLGRRGIARALLMAPVAALCAYGVAGMAVSLPEVRLALGAAGMVRFGSDPLGALFALLFGLLLLAAFLSLAPTTTGATLTALSWVGTGVLVFVAARSPLPLVAAWGILTVAAFGAVASERPERQVHRAAWVMFSVTEVGAALLLLGGLLLGQRGLLGLLAAVFGTVGLGAKAGLFPFQVWLPQAEPEAEGPVAGILSGVLATLAALGLARWLSWVAFPTWAYQGLVAASLAGALLAAIHAAVEPDLKRVLAYSTAEWLGIALFALGLAGLLHRSDPFGASLALDGFYLLLLTHALAKTALFASTEAIAGVGQSRLLDDLGGLGALLPSLARVLLFAALALVAIPPSGGFVAEWFVLESVLRAGFVLGAPVLGLLVPAVLALVLGASAIFRWYGTIFLGPQQLRTPPRPEDLREDRRLFAPLLPLAAFAWLSGIGSPWLLSLWSGPGTLPFPTVSVLAPTFHHPAETTPLNHLGGRLFAFLPGIPGTVVFPDHGFTASSPFDLAAFALVGFAAVLLARAVLRWGKARRVPVWNGGAAYRLTYAWSAEGLVFPIRQAFAPVIRLERRRRFAESAVWVEVDAADRLFSEGFRPLGAAFLRLARRIRRAHSQSLSRALGILVGAALVGLILVRLTTP